MNELMNELAFVLEEKKKYEAQEKKLKEEIYQKMINTNVDKIDNDYVKIALIPETVTRSFDMTAFKKREPELYADLEKDYHKESKRKGYVKVTLK